MSQPVSKDKRWSKANRCPVCGEAQPNCTGYAGEKDGIVFCSSSALSGGLPRGDQGQYRHWMKAPCDCGVTHAFLPNFSTKKMDKPMSEPVTKRLEATFDYGDDCYVDRFWTSAIGSNGKNKKEFIQYRQARGQEKNYIGFKKLYPDPSRRRWGNSLIYVEGEKQVDALKALGFEAFCFVGGSGGWTSEAADLYCQELKGKFVFIWPDNDEAGAKVAERMSHSFRAKGIKHVIVNALTAGLPTNGGDVIDWLQVPGNDAARLETVLEAHHKATLFEVFDFLALGKLPAPQWLIEPLLIKSYLACLFGDTQTAKSLWTLHQCLTLAEEGTQVLYLAGENSNGYHARMLAWYKFFGKLPNGNFKLIRTPVSFLDEAHLQKLLATIEQTYPEGKPQLIVIDTLSKSYLGGDENDARDMRQFVAGCELLRNTYQSSVLVVHHTPKNGGTPRGSSVIMGDFDTLIRAEKDDKVSDEKRVIYTCVKQKDAKEFGQLVYRVVSLGDGFDLAESAVLELVGEVAAQNLDRRAENLQSRLTGRQKELLAVLAMTIYDQGIGSTEWAMATGIDTRGNPSAKTMFYQDVNALLDKGFASRTGLGKTTRYSITAGGKDIIGSGPLGR